MTDPFDDFPAELAEQLAGLSVPDDVSSLLDGDVGTALTPSQTNAVEVIASIAPAPGSPYITTVQPSDDVATVLPYDQAVAYGMAVLAAAHRANYAAAVLAQAREILGGRGRAPGMADKSDLDGTARYLLEQLLADLPELDDAATAPLRFRPVIHKSGAPMVRASLPPHIEAFTGWTFTEACQHAHHVLGQAIVSQLDTAYRNTISVGFNSGENKGRAAVNDLANYYPHTDYDDAVQPPPARDPRPDPRKARPTGKGKDKRRRGR